MNYSGVIFSKKQIKTKVLTALTFFLFLALTNLLSCNGMANGTPSATVYTGADGTTQPHLELEPTLSPTVHAYVDGTTQPHVELEPEATVHTGADGTTQPHLELEPEATVHTGADGTTQPHLELEPEATVYTRADGTLMINDEPFFPIGMYHDSWAGSVEQRAEALRNMAAAGFNLICPMPTQNDTAFFDAAAALGVYVQMQTKENWQQIINTYKDHPAVLGWYIGDDVEDHYTPQELQALHDGVKALDPDHVTSIGTYDPDRFGPYITIPDVSCVYSYPIGQTRPISRVDYVLSEADTYGQTIWGVPQAFAWRTPSGRLPTPVELRNMTYQMLINGVKGLLYYTYGGGDMWDITKDAPDLWAELVAMIPEFETLSSVYMDGTRTKIKNTGASDVFAAEWIYQDHSYIVVVNTSPDHTRNVSITLPSGTLGQLRPMFAGRPDGLVYADGVLSGSIAPLEVHVYEIQPEG